jgi:hypothetical protein
MNKKIVLYPEIIASVLKEKEEDIFSIWLFSKLIDYENKGLVEQKELLNLCKLILGINSTYCYNKILKGIDKYWRSPKGSKGKKIIGLFSINKITERLKPEITRAKPVVIDIEVLKANGLNCKNIRNFFIAIVASRYHDNRPISLYSLSKNTGLCERTIQYSLKDNPYIKKYTNYNIVFKSANESEIHQAYWNFKDLNNLRYYKDDSFFYLLQQIGNTYSLNDFDRLPFKNRPKALKINDRFLIDKFNSSTYNKEKTITF